MTYNKWEKTFTSKHHKFYQLYKDNGSHIKIEWHFCGGYRIYIYTTNDGFLVKEQYASGTLTEVKKQALDLWSKL